MSSSTSAPTSAPSAAPALTRIGYIGLGSMGIPIARNLIKYISANKLEPLTVWNRSKVKYQTLSSSSSSENTEASFHAAEDLGEVVDRCDVVLTSLINDQAAQEVYGELFKAASQKAQGQETEGKRERGVIFVDQSSLKAVTSGQLAEQAKAAGATYIASPVFGRPPAAEAAKLLIVLSGDQATKDLVRPLLVPALGDRLVDIGEDVRKASALKSMGNMLLLGFIELLGEAYALGDSVDIDPAVFNNFITQFLPAPPLLAYSNNISKGLFPSGGGFSIDGGMKDARNMLSLGSDLGHPCSLPTVELALKNMERAKEIGGPSQDWSALSIVLREQAGLEPFREGTNNGQGQGSGQK
ncbi:hypothetical protein I316_01411 [Kwoniella heveanensis BCC8398]|uniref:6-phosphogluconate dehydrogenase NADP-binding domain-containing protein n=1 Tax=Kwoniella heveanensis BCC8398 TaxID=1296120 RepID=A0A1B9H0L8_9TREE|nr:hypothetical protein I316_01411 [Kwoniella heveanensis BCC8398]